MAAPASPALAGQRWKDPILVVQLPEGVESQLKAQASLQPVHPFTPEGSRIVLLIPGGAVRILTRSFHSACEPDVSFDGKRFLFAGKPSADEAWNIFEMNIDGSHLRQITKDLGDCRSPGYQSRHYQISDSNDTWYQITFVRVGRELHNEAGTGPASSLWTCKPDGTLVRQISFNLSNDLDPTIMWDGRLVYASWRWNDTERNGAGRISLLEMNTDGTDGAPFVVAAGKRIKHMPCTVSRESAIFVELDDPRWDGAGTLGCVSLQRPLHTYQSLTDEKEGLFHSPSPLPDGSLLVSRRPQDESAGHAVYRFDLKTRQTTLVFDDPQFHDVQARVVAPRTEPDGRSSAINDGDPLGKIYCMGIYNTDPDYSAAFPRGSVKRVRLVEGLARTNESQPSGAGNAVALRRLLGECEVPEDGSLNLQVPANTPIELQLLDDRGLTIRRCGWLWTRNHFNQGCVGCHEDPELTPENQTVSALSQPSVVLNPPPDQRPTVTFRKDILPVVVAKCIPCHSKNGAAPVLPEVEAGNGQSLYAAVCGFPNSTPMQRGGTYVQPGQARTSRLAWHILGDNTAGPWDGDFRTQAWKAIPADGPVQLTPAETSLLLKWIDLGAAFADLPGDATGKR
jgi:hypothetical protein